MNPDGRLLIPVHVMARQLGAETVLLDVAKGGYFGLDEVGTRIWQLVGEGRTLGEIQAQLCEEYEADAGRIQADLEALVDELLDAGLVTSSRQPGAPPT